MTKYQYIGRDKNKKRSGIVTADSKKKAMLQLKEKGIKVIEIKELPETFFSREISIGSPVKLQEFVIFLRQFATLLRAGVTLVDSTAILSQQTDSKALKKALLAIEQDLREGNPLSTAAARHKKIFSNIFINMVRAGEASGHMDDTLERLADHFEKQHDTRQKVVSALMYPAILAVVAIGVVIFLLVSVVPTFVEMFAEYEAELPAITLFVLNASKFMQTFWWLILFLIALVAVAIIIIRSRTSSKYYFDYAILRIPIIGKIFQKAAIARMTRTLSSLFASSVPIIESIAIVEKVVENEVIAIVLRKSRTSLEHGQSLTVPMKSHWVFPPLVSQMIAIGEESGTLDTMLAKVADFYEKEVDTITGRLKALIEPIMIIILAALVGTIVISIMVPMFKIYQYIG